MPRGFATAYLLLIVLILAGIGTVLFSSSKDFAGLVLGARSPRETILDKEATGVKITVISPDFSWDLIEYLCATKSECESFPTSGTWWATVSGAATDLDGHEVFVEKSEDWAGYNYIKFVTRSARGDLYKLMGTDETLAVAETALTLPESFIFTSVVGR